MKTLTKQLKGIVERNKLLPLAITLLISITPASASTQLTQNLKMVGQGEMSWLFIDLYEASLYSENGQYEQRAYPQALNIVYQKDITKSHLISATEKEWKKLSLNEQQYPYWLAALDQLWPDIKKGDELLFMVENDGRGFFYHNDQLLGGINSRQFSDAFLSIWLSKNTSEPALRKQLLGE